MSFLGNLCHLVCLSSFISKMGTMQYPSLGMLRHVGEIKSSGQPWPR